MFKIGDRVKIREGSYGCSNYFPGEGTIGSETYEYFEIDRDDKQSGGGGGGRWVFKKKDDYNLELVNKPVENKIIMSNLIDKARLLAKGEPEKSLIAKGITDINDVLTVAGNELFMDFLYRANKKDFVADPAVAALLAEKEEKK